MRMQTLLSWKPQHLGLFCIELYLGVLSAVCDEFSYHREQLSFPQKSESIFCLHIFVLPKGLLSSTRFSQGMACVPSEQASLSSNPARVPRLTPGIRLGLEGRIGLEPWQTASPSPATSPSTLVTPTRFQP